MARGHPATGLGDAGADAALHVLLLGPLTLTRAGSVIELSGPKRRALLTVLALNVGAAVSTEQIVEALWPRRQTGREEATLQVHVSHVRDQVEQTRHAPTVVVTHGLGYMLSAGTVEVDITRFDHLAAVGRSRLADDPAAALRACDEALALWRGRALQDVEYEEFVQDEIRRLELVRTETVTNRAAALVELDRDAEAIEPLEGLVRGDPASERPVRLLMRALYRTGRQADALRVFRRHARRLAEQGLEPSPLVTRLEDQILQHDPELLPAGMVSPRDIGPGRSVRGYELREVAGRGSMGVVYRAFQAAVGREVAVKVVDPDLAQSAEFVRRFAEEARLIANLEHPHIVPLHDFWREPAGAFLVMRWMDGGSLRDRMGTPMELAELGRAFAQLADALDYAHSAGVVHRDLKPANVLFDRHGNAYLGDFTLGVTGIETNRARHALVAVVDGGCAAPELFRGEGPTVASDIFGLGALLAHAATGGQFRGIEPPVPDSLREVVHVATAPDPGDRYPDMAAFRAALRDAVGPADVAAPRRVRRNPFKALEPFEEADRADFYGRDDVVETLVGLVGSQRLVALIGASGSGKSSVVKAGVVPQIRDGALAGSEEWSIVAMVPGTDPFEEFHLGLRASGVGHATAVSGDDELRRSFADALDSPNSRALLVIDQFEEIFTSGVDEQTRQRFLDNLVDLTLDPTQRCRVLLTLRADFSDRPLSRPRFGDLIAKGSFLLGPMGPEQIEDVIRRPAARVGVQVEPGLISEMIRDIASAPAYLPLLQYVLAEVFERRREDRLTVGAYRSQGGINGVLERRAQSTFAELSHGAQHATRQLFLRMVHLGEHGEETRRRVPLTELRGLGDPANVDEALDAFAAARLITYDRDPVTRIPTVEVAHETVIARWTRLRDWIDDARSTLGAHRRLSAIVHSWAESGEDPSYLLTGGPLLSAVEIANGSSLELNELEQRFVNESKAAEEAANRREAGRRQQEADLRRLARRRLTLGLTAGAVAVVVALLATFAWVQRRHANTLADAQTRQSVARGLATAAIEQLDADPELSLLLAVEAAELSIDAGEDVLPEVVDAVHRSVIAPKPQLMFERGAVEPGGGPHLIDWARDGSVLAVIDDRGGATILDPRSGDELGRVWAPAAPVLGVQLHPAVDRVLTLHADGVVREWALTSHDVIRELTVTGGVSAAVYSRAGDLLAVGGTAGDIHVWSESEEVARLTGHDAPVVGISFSPDGDRLVAADSQSVHVWDLTTGETITEGPGQIVLPVVQVEWAPTGESIAVALAQGEMYLFDAVSGQRGVSLSSGNTFHNSIAFDGSGAALVSAGADGLARGYSTGTGGAPIAELPHGGVPVNGISVDPSARLSTTVATLDADGRVRIWRDILDRSELPVRSTGLLYPHMAQADGRYLFAGYEHIFGLGIDEPPVAEVVDASSGQVLRRLPTHRSFVLLRQAAITSDGGVVAIPGPSGDIEIVPVDQGEPVLLPDSANWTKALAFDDQGRRLVGGGFDGSLATWDVGTGNLVDVVSTLDLEVVTTSDVLGSLPRTTIDDVATRPGTLEVAWARQDGRVGTWDLASGRVRVLRVMSRSASSVAYAPDGLTLAVADSTGEIVVLDADTGKAVVTPEPVAGDTELAYSPDGRYLAGAGPGPYAHLWDAESGSLLRRLRGALGPPRGVAFVKSGAELRVAGSAGVDRGYVIDPTDLVELARDKRTRELSAAECERYLGNPCDD